MLIDGSGNTTTHTVIIQRGHFLQNAQEQVRKSWPIDITPAHVAQRVRSRLKWVVSVWLNGEWRAQLKPFTNNKNQEFIVRACFCLHA
jgi:hypothetical protein